MSESPTRQLSEEFARLEADEAHAGVRERYHALAHTLAEAPPDD